MGTFFFQVGDSMGVSAIAAGWLRVGGWVTPSKKISLGFDFGESKTIVMLKNEIQSNRIYYVIKLHNKFDSILFVVIDHLSNMLHFAFCYVAMLNVLKPNIYVVRQRLTSQNTKRI